MSLNSIYTDGFTCRAPFCKRVSEASDGDFVSLELNDFNKEDVKKYFRPCTVDPNRIDVFVSLHGNNGIRRNRWRNHVGSKNALDNSVNILINGLKKYNKSRRRHIKSNKRKRKKTREEIGQNRQEQHVQPNRVPQFQVGDQTKMPLVIFGDGMKNKDHVKFKCLWHGVSGKLYKQLQRRERLGELILLDINEYNALKV
ncbi:hypothetical protein BCV72DRAFT_296959 [Rhizopus microsporus var. microsporus]|uniref:Uncharacterized protein n=1 Tax=Rhizopus microsporus var. microsporus TaxID=86635 RepID=A0A1X0QT99_RHIZD|nr:hypothetical protein BCV72DRAFT_296959 [Rhizopus microsporus var. microsporus]